MFIKLKEILEIQELDMQMLRLLRLRRDREKELARLNKLISDLQNQAKEKKEVIEVYQKEIAENDEKIDKIKERMEKLDQQQSMIKKVEEFNALTQETSNLDRERHKIEQLISEITDKLNIEKDILDKIEISLKESKENTTLLTKEINESISKINAEGKLLKDQRDIIAEKADAETLSTYEKLLKNKRDRVVVPMENRICNGCHITLTPQHENLVRKGEKLIFCEHCSRVHFWQEPTQVEGEKVVKRRRRRSQTKS